MGSGGMGLGDPQSELDLSAARTTEDGLPFVDPVERLPEEGVRTSGDTTPVSPWAHLQGGPATIAPFRPAATDPEARRRFIDDIFSQVPEDEEEEVEEEDQQDATTTHDQAQRPRPDPVVPSSSTAPSTTPVAEPPQPQNPVTVIPDSPELRPLPHSADLPPPPKPALKRMLSHTPSGSGANTPQGFVPGRGGISMANLPSHAAHPLPPQPTPDHDGVSWQPPPKAFGASGFKRGFLNLNPDSEGAKHSSDAVAGPSVWAREVESVPHDQLSSPVEGLEEGKGDESFDADDSDRGRSPSRSPSGSTKHVRIVSPSPSQRWHSQIWDEAQPNHAANQAALDQGKPLRHLKVSAGTDDPHEAKNMQVVLAQPRPGQVSTRQPTHPAPSAQPSELPTSPPTRMAKDEPEEDVADEAAKIIKLLGAEHIAAQVGGIPVPGTQGVPVSDGAGGTPLPRRPVAEPSAAPDPPRNPSRPALGRDVVERTPKRTPRRSTPPMVPTSAAAQAHADSSTPIPAPPADLDSDDAVPSLVPPSDEDRPHMAHPSPTPYPTPPATGHSSPAEGSPTQEKDMPTFKPIPVSPNQSSQSKPAKKALFGGFLKLNAAASSATPSPPSPATGPSEAQALPESEPQLDATTESESKAEQGEDKLVDPPAAPAQAQAPPSPAPSPARSAPATNQSIDQGGESDSDDSGAEEDGLADRIRQAGPRTSMGVSALDRAVMAETESKDGTKPPHARPTKAYAASLARRRRTAAAASGTASTPAPATASATDAEPNESAVAGSGDESDTAGPTIKRPGSKVRFDLADEEYRASPPGSPGPSPARVGGKVRFASRASVSDGSESDTVRRVRFAASSRAYRATDAPEKPKRKPVVDTTPDGQPILRGRGQIRFTTSSDEAGGPSDDEPEGEGVVRGRGQIRFATSSDEAGAHSGNDGYDTDPPPPEVVERAHTGTSPAEALRDARERAVSMTHAASAVDGGQGSWLAPSTHGDQEAEAEGASQAGGSESVGAAGDDEQDLSSDEDEDDDEVLSEDEYTAEDLAALRPSFDAEWDNEEEDDDDGDDLDSAMHMAEIQREYARIKARILADRHRWTASLGQDELPMDPSTGQVISSNPSDLVEAPSGSEPSSGFKGKTSKFKQERLARAFAAHAASEAGEPGSYAGSVQGLPEGSNPGQPLMALPNLTPVRTTPSGVPVDESDLTSSRGAELDGASDDEDERLWHVARERFGLAVAPEGVRPGPVPSPQPEPQVSQQPPKVEAKSQPLKVESNSQPPSLSERPTTEVGAVQERSTRTSGSGRGTEASGAPPKRMSRFKAERLGLQQ